MGKSKRAGVGVEWEGNWGHRGTKLEFAFVRGHRSLDRIAPEPVASVIRGKGSVPGHSVMSDSL